MAIMIAIVLGLLSLAFVLYPLYSYRAAQSKITAGQDGPVKAALDTPTMAEQEQNARTALQEVELDYQLGNIEEPDYRTLRERYMQRALVALKSRYEGEQEIDEEIEEQLRKLKANTEKTDAQEHNDVH